jgi:hypothetical protein
MSHFDELAKDRVYCFLKETTEPFYCVKRYLILAEEFFPGNKALVEAAGEVKSLLFNLYDIATFPEQAASNIQEAKEHLSRAFYDTHIMIVTASCDNIRAKVKQFKSSTIESAFSEYGSTIRPGIRDAQMKIREIESNRSSNIMIIHKDLSTFVDHVKQLTEFNKFVEEMIPELHRYEVEKRNQYLREKTWDICKILLAALIGGTVTWLIAKNNPARKEKDIIQVPHQMHPGK